MFLFVNTGCPHEKFQWNLPITRVLFCKLTYTNTEIKPTFILEVTIGNTTLQQKCNPVIFCYFWGEFMKIYICVTHARSTMLLNPRGAWKYLWHQYHTILPRWMLMHSLFVVAGHLVVIIPTSTREDMFYLAFVFVCLSVC